MSTSMVLCKSLIFSNRSVSHKSLYLHNSLNIVVQLSGETRRLCVLPPKAKSSHSKKRSWWKKFFSDDDGDKLGLKDEDMFEVEGEKSDTPSEKELSEGEKFEAWKSRAEAIIELREAQEGMRNEQNRRWEDWLVDETNDVNSSSWDQDWNNRHGKSREDVWVNPREMVPKRGLIKSVRDLVSWREDEDMLYEDRVFRYASINSAKFLVLLVIIPWALDFLVHDYVFMPFLDRYVKTVPLAAELLDVRRYQKLEMVKELKLEKARYRLEVEIGKSPPLSDEELWVELRHKALELRDGWRLENRRAFANILSDTVFGISLFILLYSNQNRVALLKFTGYKLINNISDAGKAFVIILIADIILGYHSDLGWKVFLDILLEHYGLEVDESSITIFICLVPVFIDTCVKLWLFKFLPGLSPKVSTILKEMKRH